MSAWWNISNTSLPGQETNGSDIMTKGGSFGTSTFNTITVVLFTVIIITGTIGCCLVIATVVRWRSLRTPCNYLLMNIAVADLCVAIVASPLRILETFISWPFGQFMCQALAPLQDVFVCVSVITHTTIALERYRAIVTPFKEKISLGKTKLVISCTWLGCYVMTGLIVAFHADLSKHGGRLICTIMVPRTFRRIYEIYLVVLFIIFPLAIQTWAYFGVVRETRKKDELFPSLSMENSGDSKRKEMMKARQRLVKILITLVVIFQICYIPRGVLMMLREFGNVRRSLLLVYIDLVSLIVYYLKHVVNPIVLFVMSSDFRTGFYWCLSCGAGKFSVKEAANKSQARLTLVNRRELRKDAILHTRLTQV